MPCCIRRQFLISFDSAAAADAAAFAMASFFNCNCVFLLIVGVLGCGFESLVRMILLLLLEEDTDEGVFFALGVVGLTFAGRCACLYGFGRDNACGGGCTRVVRGGCTRDVICVCCRGTGAAITRAA